MSKPLPLLSFLVLLLFGCGDRDRQAITMSASAVGPEAEILRQQIARFHRDNPHIQVVFQDTPDASDQRHQLYAQYLNARTGDPDILQLDVVWTPEFAGAGWILPLDGLVPRADRVDYFDAPLQANQWQGKLYGLPWFVDVGMLYYRTDLVEKPPETFEELTALAEQGQDEVSFGFLWQGARYEGLVCVFLEHLGGFGGEIMDRHGRVVVDSEAAVRALTYMLSSVYTSRIVPQDTLQWQEEQTRLQFQNGHAVFLRNWPYCARLLNEPRSQVRGKVGVTLMPRAARGTRTAALGGSQLAINTWSDRPQEAFAVISYLTQPEQMLERAQATGQLPARKSVYREEALVEALPIPAETAFELITRARPRPVTPVYTELSEVLQIWLHRALVREVEPREALESAAQQMRQMLARYGLGP